MEPLKSVERDDINEGVTILIWVISVEVVSIAEDSVTEEDASVAGPEFEILVDKVDTSGLCTSEVEVINPDEDREEVFVLVSTKVESRGHQVVYTVTISPIVVDTVDF